MFYNDPYGSDHAIAILRRLFDAIDASGIPTLIYVAPVSITLEKTNIAYLEIFGRFRALRQEYPNLTIIPHFSMRAYRGMKFIDHLHLSDAGALPRFIAANVDAAIAKHHKHHDKHNRKKETGE